ncbi:MAG TPA: hypothetical protein VK469_01480 [Candidatus Kapabacteria bacterium]|nr:hypothetical protein [Candidatus Kapabacteria bacterium]
MREIFRWIEKCKTGTAAYILLTLSNKGEIARLHEPFLPAAEMPVDYYYFTGNIFMKLNKFNDAMPNMVKPSCYTGRKGNSVPPILPISNCPS